MKRTILLAAVASAPLLAFAGSASAQLSISTATSTPVATATAVSNGPADINITVSGSIGVTSPGAAVTLNSNNSVSNAGKIGFTDVTNATGILVQGGNTGSVTNTGAINVTESYSPTDTNLDGLLDGAFATGGNRYGIVVAGTSPFIGGIYNYGAVTVRGNTSYGVQILAPITGDLQMINATLATSSAVATITNGSIQMLGDHSVGLYVAPTTTAGGPVSIGGNVRLSTVSVSGIGAQGVVINGAVGGSVDVAGPVTSTAYRTTTRASNPTLSALYTAQELGSGGQNGAAVVIGGSVANGVIVSAPPLLLSATNADLDGNGVADSQQGSGQVASYGSAPALQIGAAGLTATIGPGTSHVASGYGLVIQGTVLGDGVFDKVTSPNLPNAVPATAIQIGDPAIPATATTAATPQASVTIEGGVHNTGGIQAQSYQADATAIHVYGGAATPTIVNDSSIIATESQVDSATSGTPSINVTAIRIEPGASVTTITNNGGITADITGSGGVGGKVGAIVDASGSVANIVNTGTISAQLTQTLITSPVPGTLTAIDLSKGVGPQTLTQSANLALANTPAFNSTLSYTPGSLVAENNVVYEALTTSTVGIDAATNPSVWREVGALKPSIGGSVYFGSGGTTLNVSSGLIIGPTIDLGAGVNTVNISGANTIVSGSLLDQGAGTLTLNVSSGILSSTNPRQVRANSINVGATGILLAQGDPLDPNTARFTVAGASTFAQGAQVGLTLGSLQATPVQTYVIVQAVGAGTISAGSFSNGGEVISPFLYSEQANFVPATADQAAEITVTAGLKTQAQLGFTNAEASALPAVLAAAPMIPGVQNALLSQTTSAGLKAVYDQLLPSQGQGLFEALDKGAQSVASLTSTTPDAGTRVAGSSLWLQEVNERVRRSGIETQGSFSKLLGIVGGYERMGPGGGAVGLTLAYYNAEEAEDAQQIGGHTVASMVEGGGYYRRALGGLTVAARGAGGYAWFSSERRLVASGATEQANASWGGYFVDGHVSLAYEQRFGSFYARPELSADYLRLHESGHSETGGDPGFDLSIASRTGTRLSGQAVLVLGTQFGKAQWLRSEVRGGYREIFSGSIGDTVANFAGGSAFTLAPDAGNGGWATIGVSLKGGSQYSYLALEGDADFRSGEQRYDVRLAGRSIF
jgi:hypothetical protein